MNTLATELVLLLHTPFGPTDEPVFERTTVKTRLGSKCGIMCPLGHIILAWKNYCVDVMQ